jgi:hypothetical protein
MPSESTVKLPVGAKILRRGKGKVSITLAQELAEKGASDELVRAVGGEKAVVKVRAAQANGSR